MPQKLAEYAFFYLYLSRNCFPRMQLVSKHVFLWISWNLLFVLVNHLSPWSLCFISSSIQSSPHLHPSSFCNQRAASEQLLCNNYPAAGSTSRPHPQRGRVTESMMGLMTESHHGGPQKVLQIQTFIFSSELLTLISLLLTDMAPPPLLLLPFVYISGSLNELRENSPFLTSS